MVLSILVSGVTIQCGGSDSTSNSNDGDEADNSSSETAVDDKGAGSENRQANYGQLIEEAMTAMHRGALLRAIDQLAQAIKIRPDDPTPRLAIAQLLLKESAEYDPDEAIEHLEVADRAGIALAKVWRGRALIHKSQDREAQQWLEQYLNDKNRAVNHLGEADALTHLAKLALARSDLQVCDDLLKRASAAHAIAGKQAGPNSSSIRKRYLIDIELMIKLLRAKWHLSQEQFDTAEEILQKLLVRDMESVETQELIATVYEGQGRSDEAERKRRVAGKLNEIKKQMSRVSVRIDEVEKSYRTLSSIEPSFKLGPLRLSELALRQSLFDRAIDYAQEILDHSQDHSDLLVGAAWQTKARALHAAGRTEEANRCLAEIQKITARMTQPKK